MSDILVEDRVATRLITINRPDVYNALKAENKKEIERAIKAAGKMDEIKSLVLTAEGKAFCSGQDLNDRTVQGGENAVDLGKTLETEWNPLVQSMRQSKKPVIAAINGVVAGAGISVALSADLIIAKPGAKFVSGFSKLGLCPDAGSTYLLVRHLGYQRAMGAFYLNNPLTSENLVEVGLVNEITEDPKSRALEIAETLNQMAPLGLEIIKKNAQMAFEAAYNNVIETETASQRFLGASEDYQEGLKAFFEKRAPNFQGR